MPRYVILRHEMPAGSPRPTHWDVMLEHEGRLRTWAVNAPPQPGTTAPALALDDHRLDYLDYEGPISGGRGTVTRVERGDYEITTHTPRELVCRMRHGAHTWTLVLRPTLDQNWTAEMRGES